LVTRFEWGLTVQLQPPDQETRLAILRKKQEGAQHPLPEETLEYLAHHIKSNVRRLEGAWAKLWFATRLKGRALATAEVEDELHDLVAEESRSALTPETIQKRVAAYYDVRQADMTSKRRSASIAFPRQVAMYLCRVLTPNSLQEVGEAFGGRDHGTVLYACRVVEQRLRSNPALKQAINQITKQLNQ
jgi:chromosomal replication initiator protein